jgi:hypothetical protein
MLGTCGNMGTHIPMKGQRFTMCFQVSHICHIGINRQHIITILISMDVINVGLRDVLTINVPQSWEFFWVHNCLKSVHQSLHLKLHTCTYPTPQNCAPWITNLLSCSILIFFTVFQIILFFQITCKLLKVHVCYFFLMYLLLVEKENHNKTSDYLTVIHLVGSLSIILMLINMVIVVLNFVVTSTNIMSYNLLFDLRFMVVVFSLTFLILFSY